MVERAFGLALVFVLGLVLAVGAAVWRVVDRVGEARVYADLASFALLLTLVIGGIVFARVLLTGLAKLEIGRHAHQASQERMVIREVREKHTIDGRQPAQPQILALDRPADWRQVYPDTWRAAVERSSPAGQIAAPEAYPVELPTDVFAEVGRLFED